MAPVIPASRPVMRRPTMIRPIETPEEDVAAPGGTAENSDAATSSGRPQKGREGPWLLVLDVKTMPDRDILPTPLDPQEQIPLPKPMYHRIAALGFLRAQIISEGNNERFVVEECRAGGKASTSEADLLNGFWRSFEQWKPRILTFNGRGFGLPVIKYRSMRYGLTAKYFHSAGDKWNGYNHRYSSSYHVDLMDFLSDHNASSFPSLVDVALGFGLPVRPDFDTSPDAQRAPGFIEQLRNASEADTVTLFLSYIRWRLFTGAMTREGYQESAQSLYDALSKRNGNPLLPRLLKSWSV